MAGLVEKWGKGSIGKYGYSNVGAVVGYIPETAFELREQMPHTFFLVPGYGAQGAGADDIVGAFDKKGSGAIINASRSLMCAYRKSGGSQEDFAKAAKAEAERMRDEIRRVIR